MPLGDSITFGEPDLDYGGYRNLLGTLLTGDGYIVDFVGSQQTGIGLIPDPDNEGHSGWKISNIKDAIDSQGWLEIHQPDLILLHIGTNDINQGYSASAPENLSALLDDILLRLPEVHIIVALIIPYSSDPVEGHQTYNAAIPGIVVAKGPRASMVDMQSILSQNDYADTYHPNAQGYDKMARAWEAAILTVIPTLSVTSSCEIPP
jgi:lysophospholipase L1-like esterase